MATCAQAAESEAGPSRIMRADSKPVSVAHACYLDQPDGASWFGPQARDAFASEDRFEDGVRSSLVDLYAECLWLGEFHTGLSHFLHCIDRLNLSNELQDIVLALCHLIKSRTSISSRHRSVSERLFSAAEASTDGAPLPELDGLSKYEVALSRRAVRQVAPRLRTGEATDSDMDSLRERWTSSMESREIQLQILVTMSLLQIVSQEPRALEAAKSRMDWHPSTVNASASSTGAAADAAIDDRTEPPRKRSRKLEKAKRWRGTKPHAGSEDAFAWNQSVRRRLAGDWSHDEAEKAETEVLEMQGAEVLAMDHLSKRLEALVDILCLRQVAAGIGSELEDLLSDVSVEANQNDSLGGARPKAKGMLFGSSARKLMQEDELDDAQWLCSSVLEPHFEASLPRQCSLFRSKCFVSLQARTPARTIRLGRTGSSGSPATRAAATSSTCAAPVGMPRSPTGRGLSHVLERELAGRRSKRNPLAKRSAALGHGREVDMGRRLARSVSVTSGLQQEKRSLSGVFSRSSTRVDAKTASTPGNGLGEPLLSRGNTFGGSGRSPSLSQIPTNSGREPAKALALGSFAASGHSTGKRLLVLSTPQKEPASRTVGTHHYSQMETPRLVFPSLVMESPTQDGAASAPGGAGRFAERSLSFGALGDMAFRRSPSPDAV